MGSSRFIYNLYLDKKDKMSNYKKVWKENRETTTRSYGRVKK